MAAHPGPQAATVVYVRLGEFLLCLVRVQSGSAKGISGDER